LGHKKKGKYGVKIRPQNNYPQVTPKKHSLSTGMKVLIGLALIAVIVVAASFGVSSQPTQLSTTAQQTPNQQTTQTQTYPQNVAPVFYTTPTLTANGAKVSIPASYVAQNKLVFVDLKLQTPSETLQYGSRSVPLAIYKNGEYLPLVLISTPSGNVIAGIRTCEPCGSFNFHIVKGTNLKCDVCGTEWTLENFTPVSGGCTTYPPPKLTSTVNGDNLEIDLSALPVQLAPV
jgi:flagellar basal body-associated protein FliL